MDIGKQIFQIRSERGMTQQELADILFISRDLVSKWENGTRRPDYQMIGRIADVFDVSADIIVDKNDMIFNELCECGLPDGEFSENELVGLLNSFLNRLRKKDADLFMMRYYFLKSTAEIADEFGIGESHVRSRLSKIRSKIRKFFKEESL